VIVSGSSSRARRAAAENLDLPKASKAEEDFSGVEFVALAVGLRVDPPEGIRKIQKTIEREESERLRSGGESPGS
jgi:hypothetical protein